MYKDKNSLLEKDDFKAKSENGMATRSCIKTVCSDAGAAREVSATAAAAVAYLLAPAVDPHLQPGRPRPRHGQVHGAAAGGRTRGPHHHTPHIQTVSHTTAGNTLLYDNLESYCRFVSVGHGDAS